ncbi:helix-turn-helix domain-containing protein [Myxococcus stipitatus]|uniref:helix-turn-helix domain-containing protein n=1 Tax=Myxococcus stipitatus TaxID=83455 RepID=UPI001F232E42|nr:helix-turn-helix domain-containing protein [Myxococcus stipitatus]MCE9668339.1 helix-turn-helix domain-containing protein [Myxococcus stipitatus]
MGPGLELKDITAPGERSAREAAEAVRRLAPLLRRSRKKKAASLRLHAEESSRSVSIDLPLEAVELFARVLEQMARGRAVTIVPIHAELTTQEAANLLNVSRPHLIRLLDEGHMPFHRVGTHRRVRVADLLAYKRRDEARRRKVADALTDEAQKLRLGY